MSYFFHHFLNVPQYAMVCYSRILIPSNHQIDILKYYSPGSDTAAIRAHGEHGDPYQGEDERDNGHEFSELTVIVTLEVRQPRAQHHVVGVIAWNR